MFKAKLLFCFFCFSLLKLVAQNPLSTIIEENKAVFGDIFEHPEQYEVQILYTQINRTEDNTPTFTTFSYGLQEQQYFYPASTVKMPTALLALEKLNELKIIGLDKNTPMRIGAGSPPQTAMQVDSTAENNLPSIAHFIKKIFLVSDNDAYNRLYEFIGQQQLNERLWQKGFTHSRIIHRLSAPNYDKTTNRYTNPITFYKGDSILYHQGEVYSKAYPSLDLNKEIRGKGYENKAGKIVKESFDFRYKNYISLQHLHDILKTLLFPNSVPAQQRFRLSDADYAFLYQYLSQTPQAEKYPYFDKPDGYVKFFLFGGSEEKIPEHIRVFNKVGDAYGYLTDVAYVVDFKNQLEFMVAATIHVNDNRIYNDGVYEYEEKGFPFFKNLGWLLYNYELKRNRNFLPDLSKFE